MFFVHIFLTKKTSFFIVKGLQLKMKKEKKGITIEAGIKRLSFLKKKGLISDEEFSSAEELIIQSEMEIPAEKS